MCDSDRTRVGRAGTREENKTIWIIMWHISLMPERTMRLSMHNTIACHHHHHALYDFDTLNTWEQMIYSSYLHMNRKLTFLCMCTRPQLVRRVSKIVYTHRAARQMEAKICNWISVSSSCDYWLLYTVTIGRPTDWYRSKYQIVSSSPPIFLWENMCSDVLRSWMFW